MVTESVLLGVNEKANCNYRNSYSGVLDGRKSLADNIFNMIKNYPFLSKEVALYPLDELFGKDMAAVILERIYQTSMNSKDGMNGLQMNK